MSAVIYCCSICTCSQFLIKYLGRYKLTLVYYYFPFPAMSLRSQGNATGYFIVSQAGAFSRRNGESWLQFVCRLSTCLWPWGFLLRSENRLQITRLIVAVCLIAPACVSALFCSVLQLGWSWVRCSLWVQSQRRNAAILVIPTGHRDQTRKLWCKDPVWWEPWVKA